MTEVSASALGRSDAPAVPAMRERAADLAAPRVGGRIETIASALQRVTTVHAQQPCGRWQIRVPKTRQKATVELTRDWLTIDVPLRALRGQMSCERIGPLLHTNALMKGCFRNIGDGLGPRRHLVSDIPADILPWDSHAAIESLIAASIGGLAAYLRDHVHAIDRSTLPAPTREQVTEMLGDAGWPAQPDESNHLEVPLDVPGDYVVATVNHGELPTRLTVSVLENELRAAPYDCRRAATVLLWLTASGIQMVRPMRSRRRLSMEVCLPPVPLSATALNHGCVALSVAARRLSAEGRLLIADEQLARTYLSNLGLAKAD